MRAILSILLAIVSLILIPVCVVMILLIIQAQADHSRFFGFGVLALFISCVLWFQHLTLDVRRSGWWTVLFVLVTGGLFGWSYVSSPTGASSEASAMFESTYVGNESYPRWHPANLIAEPDQLNVVSQLVSLGGLNLDKTGGKQTRQLIKENYQALRRQAPEMVNFGSQLHTCYDQWFGKPAKPDQLYVYRPAAIRKGAQPVLLLLHGKTGSLKAALWSLRHAADELGMAIVAPNFGLGRWEHQQEAGFEVVKAAVAFCAKDPALQASSITLVGYGAGGKGVSYAMTQAREKFRGVVYIGAQLDRKDAFDLLGDKASAGSRPPVLVIQGGQETKARIDEIDFVTNELQRFGAPMTLKRADDEGPLLLFSHPKSVSKKVVDWVRSNGRGA